jgi:chromosome partitioning protein
MSAKVIAVVNQKGGAGKTTLAMILASALAENRARVLVADADPQGSACFWAQSNPGFPVTVEDFSEKGEKLAKKLGKRRDQYDFILVDSPPHAELPIIQSALSHAHLALVPLNPSPLDLRASLAIRDSIYAAREDNPGLMARLVLNQVQGNTRMSSEISRVLMEFGIPVLKTQLHQRMAYRQCVISGGSVFIRSLKAPLAMLEVNALKAEVLHILRA